METLQIIEELLLTIVKSIVKHPDEVKLRSVETTEGDIKKTQIDIITARDDIRIAIGAKGTTAEAVTRIVILAATRLRYRRKLTIRVDAPETPKVGVQV